MEFYTSDKPKPAVNRAAYYKRYYKRNRELLLPKFKARYHGEKHEELKAYFRNRYTPKKSKQSKYR